MNDTTGEELLCAYINTTPSMQSLLYDCNLLPEVIMSKTGAAYRENPDWSRMLYIADHWRAREINHKRELAAAIKLAKEEK